MRRSLLISFLLLTCRTVLAWNTTGHETVAAIAWDNLQGPTRAKVITILNGATAGDCLHELAASDPRTFFIRAATWPDVVRPDNRAGHPPDTRPCTQFHQQDWHFFDHFWSGTSGGTGADAPHDRPDVHGKPVNAVLKLQEFVPIVACAHAPCKPAAERAHDLAWILHLVGDIHQPLHDAARVTTLPAEHQGDRGGNLFALANPADLHKFWDDIIDETIPRNGASDLAYATTVAARFEQDHPRPTMDARIEPGQFDTWSTEGFHTAERLAYPASLHRNSTPAAAYRQTALVAADDAIALAGYRLAFLLNHLDAPGPQPANAKPANVQPAAAALPRPDHIVVVIEENKSYTDVIDPQHVPDGQSRAPYINNVLGPMAAVFTRSFALHHPSRPNYLELFTGTNAGQCTDECFPPLAHDNLAARIRGSSDVHHNTFIGFAEHFAPGCSVHPTAQQYVQRHCPWLLVAGLPPAVTKDFAQFPSDFNNLPAVAFVIPDLFGDMHSVDARTKEAKAVQATHPGQKFSDAEKIRLEVGQGDQWLRAKINAYAQWAVNHNSLLIVTWDEDSADHPHIADCAAPLANTTPPANRIPTLIIGAHVTHRESDQQITHRNLLSTILALEGLPPIDAGAGPITGIWH